MDKYSQGNKFKKKLTSSRRMSKTKQDIYKMESKDPKTLRLCEQMRGSEKNMKNHNISFEKNKYVINSQKFFEL